jgi:hypothetical protein
MNASPSSTSSAIEPGSHGRSITRVTWLAMKATPPPRALSTSKPSQCFAGTLADLGNLAREQRDCATAHTLYRESLKVFQELEHKRGIARLLECFACSASIQFQAERSLRLAGAAAALRQNIGAPLTPAEQAKLEAHLDPARYALANTSGATAWLEGWGMPLEKAIEKAIEEALRPDAESSSSSHTPARGKF